MPNYVVRCGVMRTLHVMQARQDFKRGQRVIARTPRGLEVGDVLCEATPAAVEQLDSPPNGSIQREVNQDDDREIALLAAKSVSEADTCFRVIQEMQLPMDLVDIERLYGGERLVVYYLSDDRVDFRDLVKRLAHEFQTRIEMRQIGVRDEAKLLADYGDCGKPVCCNTHLIKMPPVSMKMAKLQKATLDPNKISGRCGRLKCCLRYEYDIYEDHLRSLPRIGSSVITKNGRGRVIGQEILSRQLLVVMEDNRRIMIDHSEVLSVLRSGQSENGSQESDVTDSNDGRRDSDEYGTVDVDGRVKGNKNQDIQTGRSSRERDSHSGSPKPRNFQDDQEMKLVSSNDNLVSNADGEIDNSRIVSNPRFEANNDQHHQSSTQENPRADSTDNIADRKRED